MKSTEKKLPIIEIFSSIEGEGTTSGDPVIFVRLSGCNLRCMFKNSICDTAYSSFEPEKGKYSIQDVIEMIDEHPLIPTISISGGEPFLHQSLVESIVEIANLYDKFIIIETNGSLVVKESLLREIDLLNISPKLSSSEPTPEKSMAIAKAFTPVMERHAEERFNVEALWKMMTYSKDYRLKYVVGDETDFEEIEEQIKTLIEYDSVKRKRNISPLYDKDGNQLWYDTEFIMPWNIVLMPAGLTNEELAQNRKMIAEYCVKRGYSYSDRLQVVIWGTERGV